MKKLVLPILAIVLCFSQTACDLIASVAGVDKVEIPTETFAGNLPVAPNTTTVTASTVNVTERDLPDVFDVDEFTLAKEDITFTESVLTKEAATGTITAVLIINGQPCALATANIENNVVTSVTPSVVKIGQDLTAMKAILDTANQTQLGTLTANWQNLTLAQVVDLISTAIKTQLNNLNVRLVVRTTGNIRGNIKIKKFTLGLDF